MKALVYCVLVLSTVSLKAQYTSDRYHSSKVLSEAGVDTCFSYSVNGNVEVLEDITVFNRNGDDAVQIDIKSETITKYSYRSDHQLSARYFFAISPGSKKYDFIENDSHEFNDKGQRIAIATIDRFMGSGEYARTENTYKGDSISQSQYLFNAELVSTTKYAFDRLHSCIVETITLSTGMVSKSILKYNAKGHLVAFFDLNANGDTTLSHRYNVDANGRRTEFFAYNAQGKLTQYYRYMYSDKGLLESEEMYTEIKNGNIKKSEYSKIVYRYTFRKV